MTFGPFSMLDTSDSVEVNMKRGSNTSICCGWSALSCINLWHVNELLNNEQSRIWAAFTVKHELYTVIKMSIYRRWAALYKFYFYHKVN